MGEITIGTASEKDFSKYGQKFQLSTLSLFIQDKPFAYKIKDIIKPEYFDNKYCQWFCEEILKQISLYKLPPTFDDLKTVIETTLGTSAKIYLMTLKNIQEADLSRKEFIEAEVAKFCFTKFALQKLEEEKNNVLLGNFDTAKGIAFSIYKPLATDIREISLKDDFTALFKEAEHVPIPTPLPSFNKVSKGGPGAGDLCVVVAQSHLGKTAYLTATARHAAEEGKNVVYFTLETKGEQILARAVAGLVGVNQEVLRHHPQLIEQRIKTLKGEIRFVQIKATMARTDTIRAKVEELKAEGFFPELIIVDGLNQVKSPLHMKFQNGNDKFEFLAEELRDFAGEEQLPVYVAFQGNRGSFNVEYSDEQNIGKAIEVFQVADWMIMLTQTIQMQETGEIFAQLLKNRLGPKGMTLKIKYNPNHGTFTELESVQRSMLYNKSLRNDVQKGLDTIRTRLKAEQQV